MPGPASSYYRNSVIKDKIARRARVLACTAIAFINFGPRVVTQLKPATLEDFTTYSRAVAKDFERRINSTRASFMIAESPAALRSVMAGKCVVRQVARKPVGIRDGLIHDWTGDIFIPHASALDVLRPMQDFDRHAQIYPGMIKTRLLQRTGNHLSGYWRLFRGNGLMTVTLDIYDEANYSSPAPGKWLCEAHTPKIIQIENAGTPEEKQMADGVGYGFLWRMDAYWLIEERDGGVLAECRSLSLSTGIPAPAAWIVMPMVESQPREAIQSTLESTRAAVERERVQARRIQE